jgi:GPH family glycoside/pentoside/hexuronide:cation symporter
MQSWVCLTLVGTIFMITRFFDVFTDPLFGVLGDKVHTRCGRRKPAIVVGIPILLLGSYRVFIPAEIVSEYDLLVNLLMLCFGWTLLTLAHTAWASEMSTDYDQRSRIMSALQFSGLLGAVVVLAVPAVVDAFYPEADMRMRSKIMDWLVFLTLPVLFTLTLTLNREPKISEHKPLDWQEAWQSLFANRPLRRLLLANLLMGIQGGINGSVHFFFVIQVLKLPTSAGIFLVAIFLTGLLMVPAFVPISRRFGKHRTLCFGALQSSVATAMFLSVPEQSFG